MLFSSFGEIEETARDKLVELIQSSKSEGIVLHEEACLHIARIVRILRQPRGHALILGNNRTGKQSLSKVAIQMSGNVLLEVPASDWKGAIKPALMSVGMSGKPVALLLGKRHLDSCEVMEDVSSLLNADSFLTYTPADFVSMRKVCSNSSSRDEVKSCFEQRMWDNVRVVLCTSPTSPSFLEGIKSYPVLISHSTIDWVEDWSKDSLVALGKAQLESP